MAIGVPLLGTSSARRNPLPRRCLFQAVAHGGEKGGRAARIPGFAGAGHGPRRLVFYGSWVAVVGRPVKSFIGVLAMSRFPKITCCLWSVAADRCRGRHSPSRREERQSHVLRRSTRVPGQAHQGDRTDQRRRRPGGRNARVARAGDDLDLRRRRRAELRLRQPRLHRRHGKAGKTALQQLCGAKNACGFVPRAGSSASGSSPARSRCMKNWFTPPAFNEGAGRSSPSPKTDDASADGHAHEVRERLGHAVRPRRHPQGAVARRPTISRSCLARRPPRSAGKPGVEMVAYETANQITNRGPAFSKEKGPDLDLDSGHDERRPADRDHRPLQAGPGDELGPVVKSDYFGKVPADRLKVTPRSRALPRRQPVPLEDRHLAAPRAATCSARSTSRRAC